MRIKIAGAVFAGSLLLLAAGCGSSSASSTSSTGSLAASSLPAGKAATGTPVKIGFVNLEGGAAISLPQIREGVQAGVKYANGYLNGFAGHPIQLDICNTDGTEASSTACGNQMASAGVQAVLMGQDANPANVLAPILAAKIPYITESGNSFDEFLKPGSFSLTGGVPTALAAEALYAGQQHWKTVDLITIDVPAAAAAAQQLGVPLFKSQGVALSVTPVAAGTADLTPQLATVTSANAVSVLGDANLCTAFFKSAASVQLKIPVMVYGACAQQEVYSAVPASSYTGAFVPLPFDLSTPTPDLLLYKSVVAKFSPGADTNSTLTAQGYVEVLSVVRALAGTTGVIDTTSIAAAMSGSTNIPFPLGRGITFTCNGKQIPSLAAVCSNQTMWFQLNAKGLPIFQQKMNLAPVFAAG